MKKNEAQKRLPQRYIHNLKRIIKRTKRARDHFVIVVAKEGEGKSSFVQLSGWAISDLQDKPGVWDIKHNTYDVETMIKTANRLQYHAVLNADEGTSMFFRGDANTREGKRRMKFLTTCRSKRLIWFVCVTESGFARIDPMLLQDRCETLIRIPKRGRMWWYSKEKMLKIKVDEKTRTVKKWSKPNWKANWKQMPKKDYDAYETHKHNELAQEDDDSDEWMRAAEAANLLGVTRHAVLKWIRENKIRGKKNPIGWWLANKEDILKILHRYDTK